MTADEVQRATRSIERRGEPDPSRVRATVPPPAGRGNATPTPATPPPGGRGPVTTIAGESARPPKRRGPWWSLSGIGVWGWVWRVAAVLVLAVIVWGVAGYLVLNSAVSDANARISAAGRAQLTPTSGPMITTPTNILFIGSDSRPDQKIPSRSDTMMVMRVDPNKGVIKYLSIPRDTLLTSGPYANQKINAAYFFGGQAGAISTVKKFTGLSINHIVIVSFTGLSKVVNDLGGITVNNPTPLHNCAYPWPVLHVSFPGGTISLNGTTALEYVRVRDCDTDFQRQQRQQVFLSALKSKIVSPGALLFAPWNGASLIGALSTDMSASDLVQLGWAEMTMSQSKAYRYILPGTAQYIGGVDYVINDPVGSAKVLHAFLGN